MRRIYLTSLLFLLSCASNRQLLTYSANTLPAIPPGSVPSKIIAYSDYDVTQSKFRNAKENLFIAIRDSMLRIMASEWEARSASRILVAPAGLHPLPAADSTIQDLLNKHGAEAVVVLHSVDIKFDQTGVDVEKTDEGKTRTAHYDIVSEARYDWYNRKGLVKELQVKVRRRHSDRNVISGLLAAGPNIVSNQRDAFDMARANVHRFTDLVLPGKANRNRVVFVRQAFASVGAALSREDYDAALVESLKLAENSEGEQAAQAFYNCAVLAERKDQPEQAREYLLKAMQHFPLPEARAMLQDFQ